MIDFRNKQDLQFGCEYIEEIIDKHPQNEITLRELNKILIAEGLFDSTPISGVTIYEWGESRALASLIRVVQGLGTLSDWLPSFEENKDGINENDRFRRKSITPDPEKVKLPRNISMGARKHIGFKKLKRLSNRYFYARTEANFELFEEAFTTFFRTMSELPIDIDPAELHTPTNEELLTKMEQIITAWPLRKSKNLPDSVLNRRIEFKRFVEPWSVQETSLLADAYEITQNTRRLSQTFQRSPASIEFKLEEIGVAT